MTEKSKFDRKTPSAGFVNFILMWMLWSVLVGIITMGTLATVINRTFYGTSSLVEIVIGVLIATAGIFWVSRWQHQTLHRKTGREFKRWAFWSALWWGIGMSVALVVTNRLMIRSGYDTLATIGIMGVGLAIVYAIYGFCQSWLLGIQLDGTLPYTIVMVAGVLFWMLFVGDPRRIALGGLLAPAMQGLVSGITLMWLFHLSKLGNIAMKAKREETA